MRAKVSFSKTTASRVSSTMATISLATIAPVSPAPMMTGESLRAATMTPGSNVQVTARPYAPTSLRAAMRTASSRSPSYASSIRCAMTSVSVSLLNSCPRPASSSFSAAKFSMMPLWTTAKRPEQSVWGCALRSLGRPWVAQRVCPMPQVPSICSDATMASRPDTFPTLRLTTRPASVCTAMPAES